MSDIIIFPKLQGNLMKQIRAAMNRADYETAYDLFNDYEKHFELSEDEHLIKLDCLYQLESFLELREESSILLNQGHYAYSTIVPYFIESLLKLKQYKTVIELIESLRSEDVDHKLIVSLMPFYDEAHHQLNKRNDAHLKFIQTFKDNDYIKQLDLMMELIESEDFRFQMSFVQLLEHTELHPVISSMMIEYLLLSRYKGEVKFAKLNINTRVNISNVVTMVKSPFMLEVVDQIKCYYENNSPNVVTVIVETMKLHNTVMYPIGYQTFFNCETQTVVEAYIIMFNRLFNIEDNSKDLSDPQFKEILDAIYLLERYNLMHE